MNIKSIFNAIRGETSAAPPAPADQATLPIQTFNARKTATVLNAAAPADGGENQPEPAAPAAGTSNAAALDTTAPTVTNSAPVEKSDPPAETITGLNPDEINRRYDAIQERKQFQAKLDALARDEADARQRENMVRIHEMARLEREEAERRIEAARASRAVKTKTPPAWEIKYGQRIYGVDRDDPYGFLPKPILRVVLERGGLRESIEKIATQLEPFFVRYEEAEKHLGELNRVIPEEMLRDAMRKDASLAADGKFAELVSGMKHPDPDEIHRLVDFRRTLLREAQKLAAESCAPLIFEAGERLQSAARTLADDLDSAERDTAQRYGVRFAPSVQLRACVAGGFFYATSVRSTFSPAARPNPRRYIKTGLLGDE